LDSADMELKQFRNFQRHDAWSQSLISALKQIPSVPLGYSSPFPPL